MALPSATPAPAGALDAGEASAGEASAAVDSAAPDGGHPDADADADADATTQPRTDPATVTLRVETPYRSFERPRPKGRVLAAGRDEDLARWNVGGTGDPEFISNRPGYHPGARVRVDTDVLSGSLPKRAPFNRRTGRHRRVLSHTGVLAQARRLGYWPFRLCFEAGLRRNQRAHGATELRTTILASGKIGKVRVEATELDDDAVVDCLSKELKQLRFEPGPGRATGIRVVIKLWPGDAPVPSIEAPDDFENPGRLPTSSVEGTLAPIEHRARRCYARGLDYDSKLWGRIALQIDIDERGRVRRVRESESRFPDPRVTRCIEKKVKRLRFAAPEGGALSIVYAVRLGEMPADDR